MKSRGEISSPRIALSDVRRKFMTETPGTSTGYCIARNRPSLARSSASISTMSSPAKIAVPPVIS